MSENLTQEELSAMLADEMQEKAGAAVKYAVESVFGEFWRDMVDAGAEENGMAIHLEVRRDGPNAGEVEVMSVQWLPKRKKKATGFLSFRAEPQQLQIDFDGKGEKGDGEEGRKDGEADFQLLRYVARSLNRSIVYACGVPEGKVGKYTPQDGKVGLYSPQVSENITVPVPDGMEEQLLKDAAATGAIVVNRSGHLAKETVRLLLESDVNVACRIADGVWHYVLDESQADGFRAAPGAPEELAPREDWCWEGVYTKFA